MGAVKPVKFTEKLIQNLLAERYSGQEWAFFPHLPDSTGSHSRTADGFAFNLFPSRGLETIGFEIKVSRSDWLSELKQPEKSMAVQKYCDRWFIVAPKGVVDEAELPKSWGLIIATEKSLRVQVKAPELKAEVLNRNVIASIMRKAKEFTENDEAIQDKISQSYRKGISQGKTGSDAEINRLTEKLSKYESIEENFRKNVGYSLFFHEDRLIEMVNIVRNFTKNDLKTETERRIQSLKKEVELLEGSLPLAEEQYYKFKNAMIANEV